MATLSVAHTILDQLGGRRFIIMTGSRSFVGAPDSLMFRLARRAPSGANKVRIRLDGTDTYTMLFLKVTGHQAEIIKEIAGLYADQLQAIFTQETGLETKL